MRAFMVVPQPPPSPKSALNTPAPRRARPKNTLSWADEAAAGLQRRRGGGGRRGEVGFVLAASTARAEASSSARLVPGEDPRRVAEIVPVRLAAPPYKLAYIRQVSSIASEE